MGYLMFLLGVIFGSVVTLFIYNRKTIRGYFTLDKVADDEYLINIHIPNNLNIVKKEQIILKKSSYSQK